VRQEVRDIFSN